MLRRTDSLAARLILGVLCATLLAWLAFAAALHYEMRQQARAQQQRQLEAYADMLWQGFGDEDDIGAPTAHDDTPTLAFALYEHAGGLLAASSSPPLPLPAANVRQTRHRGETWVVALRGDDERTLVVGEVQYRQQEVVEEVIERLAAPAVLILAALLATLVFAVRRGLRPLRAVAGELERRAVDNLEALDLPAPREIAPIVQRLNALFAQLAATLERERRFTADAAHELRTPLAALRVQLEIACDSPRPPARAKALTQALAGVDRATHLLGQLLDLARLDYARLAAAEALDLPALARQALIDSGLPCTAATLRVGAAQPCRGHAALIGLLLRNLLDNARRYAGEDASIAITVDGCCLAVEDDGPGVDAEVLARLGERFFRPPGQAQSGAGLGLSIAQRIAELHGGRLDMDNRATGGLRVSLRLP